MRLLPWRLVWWAESAMSQCAFWCNVFEMQCTLYEWHVCMMHTLKGRLFQSNNTSCLRIALLLHCDFYTFFSFFFFKLILHDEGSGLTIEWVIKNKKLHWAILHNHTLCLENCIKLLSSCQNHSLWSLQWNCKKDKSFLRCGEDNVLHDFEVFSDSCKETLVVPKALPWKN